MAKGQQRSTKEAKKPKKTVATVKSTGSAYAQEHSKPGKKR